MSVLGAVSRRTIAASILSRGSPTVYRADPFALFVGEQPALQRALPGTSVKTSRHDLDPGRQHSAPAFQHIGDPKIFLDLVPARLQP